LGAGVTHTEKVLGVFDPSTASFAGVDPTTGKELWKTSGIESTATASGKYFFLAAGGEAWAEG